MRGDQKNQVWDRCLSPVAHADLMRKTKNHIISSFAVNVIVWFVLAVVPLSMVNNFTSCNVIKFLQRIAPFDLEYFVSSSNSRIAERVWMTEFLSSFYCLLLSVAAFTTALKFALEDKNTRSKFSSEPLFQFDYFAGIILISFLVVTRLLGFSEDLILGHYRFTIGPNDGALLFYAAGNIMIAAGSWQAGFFTAAVTLPRTFIQF
jgi:hypothetical protein